MIFPLLLDLRGKKLLYHPIPFPLNLEFGLDGTVLLFTGLVSAGAGLFFGLIPALQSTNPDVAPTLAVVAAFAEGTTIINNIEHLRIKECDRLSAVVTELRKLGAEVEEEDARMIIHGRAGGTNLHGASIETYEDHRMAMCFAVAGLKIPGVTITGEECVAKSFPDFWERFARLGQ